MITRTSLKALSVVSFVACTVFGTIAAATLRVDRIELNEIEEGVFEHVAVDRFNWAILFAFTAAGMLIAMIGLAATRLGPADDHTSKRPVGFP